MVSISDQAQKILAELEANGEDLGFALGVALELLERVLLQTFEAVGMPRDDAVDFARNLAEHVENVTDMIVSTGRGGVYSTRVRSGKIHLPVEG